MPIDTRCGSGLFLCLSKDVCLILVPFLEAMLGQCSQTCVIRVCFFCVFFVGAFCVVNIGAKINQKVCLMGSGRCIESVINNTSN